MRVATNGALYLSAEDNERDAAVTSLDLETGSQTSPATRPVPRFPGTNFEPAWSADGRRLAYVSARRDGSVLGIRDASGETRELQLRPRLAWFLGLNWSRDGRSIAVTAVDAKGRPGIFRVDAGTGEVTPIALPIPLTYEGIFWSPDERRIYYRALDGAVREREVATGNERIVLDERGGDNRIGPISVSPDGRWIATYRSEAVLLLPLAVTLDGAIDGQLGKIRLSPDGRQLAYVAARSYQRETWVLENFLPPTR
jgi:Tol biopolymer transport system component